MVHPRFGILAYDFVVQPVTNKPLLPGSLAKDIVARELTAEDPILELMPAPAEVKAARFRSGATALGVFRREAFIGYVWLTLREYREDDARLHYVLPDESTVFDFDLNVLPEYRGGIAFAAVWHCTYKHLLERGATTTVSRISRSNVPSFNAHARLGARRIGTAVVVQVGRFECAFSTTYPFVVAGTQRWMKIKLDPIRHPS
jgi:hypothetical protein